MPTDAEWEGMKLLTMGWQLTPWVTKLAENDRLWLVKERGEAFVLTPWIPPTAGGKFGQLFISRMVNNRVIGTEQWYVNDIGCGFDGKVLIRPQCELAELERRASPYQTDMTRLWASLVYLRMRVTTLERVLQGRGIDVPVSTQVPDLPIDVQLPQRSLSRRAT